ncbi:MAG: hypothetical protein ACI9VR_002215 [Cognaticolwellia sp.]|jgi:hypothetical protein
MPQLRKLHLSNAEGRDATVLFAPLKTEKPPQKGLAGGAEVVFRRYLSSGEKGLHSALQAKLGDHYGQALVDGDPEIDLEKVGREIGSTNVVQLSASGEVLYAAPQVIEVLLGPDGEEKERRAPLDTPANVNDELPIRWTGREMARGQVVGRFLLSRSMQVQHVDGLSYDYLFAMAKLLDQADAMVLVGAGAKGRDPLVFQVNGSPYRGFLEGRVDGERYLLLLHLSNMELKRPTEES